MKHQCAIAVILLIVLVASGLVWLGQGGAGDGRETLTRA